MPSGGGSNPDSKRDDLSRFVTEWLDHQEISVRELARRARDPASGRTVSKEWVTDLAAGHMERTPDIDRLRALAAAMGVDADHLAALAAAQWLPGALGVEVSIAGETVWVSVPAGRDPEEWQRHVIGHFRDFRDT